MTLRTFVIAAMLGSLVGIADARTKQPPPKLPSAKLNKKQLEIERREWMAQYYLLRANDLAGAAKEYQAIVKLDPANIRASLALVQIYKRDKKEKQAVDVLVKLSKKNAKSDVVWLALAEHYFDAGDDKAMKAAVDKVLAIDPVSSRAHWLVFERAYQRVRNGDASAKPEALEAARKLVRVTPRSSSFAFRAAERAVVELSGDPIELTVYDAKRAYSAAFDSGLIGSINKQMATARRGFEECTKAQPQNEECHYYLGLVYSSVKASDSYDPKKALDEYALAPGKPLAWVESARLLRANDKNAEARTALQQALKLDDSLAVAHIELGILAKLDGKTDAAVAAFVAAYNADPYGAVGSRAITELTKVKPTHPLVTEGMLRSRGGDVFSTDRYQAVVALIEKELGGVEATAPEKGVLEDIVRKLAEASAIKQQFKVQLVASKEVNAFALADGRVYVTRGLLEMLQKKYPNRPIDAKHDVLGHILAHELAHVTRRHTMNTAVFQEAIKDGARMLDRSVLTHVTRLHEIDADREGIVMAFLAGFHPRGGIEFMEVMGKEMEIPRHLDHPTFDERVEYLTEYWTNDVRYAFVSFKLGVTAMDKGFKAEASDMKQAIAAYEEAVDHFKRFRTTLPSLKEAMNDLGVAYTKLGVLASTDSPFGRWQTRFSIERNSAVKYVGLARDEEKVAQRGTDKTRIPWQLREAIAMFKEALATDEDYGKARLNLASAYIAAGQLDNANTMLGKLGAKSGVGEADVALIRGIALGEAKDWVKAKAAFEAALSSPGAKRAAAYNIAKTLELSGNAAEAKKAYAQYAKLYPGGPWAKAAEAAAAKP